MELTFVRPLECAVSISSILTEKSLVVGMAPIVHTPAESITSFSHIPEAPAPEPIALDPTSRPAGGALRWHFVRASQGEGRCRHPALERGYGFEPSGASPAHRHSELACCSRRKKPALNEPGSSSLC